MCVYTCHLLSIDYFKPDAELLNYETLIIYRDTPSMITTISITI